MFTSRLSAIYDDASIISLLNTELTRLVQQYQDRVPQLALTPWDQSDALLISYGDSLKRPNEKPLSTFNAFANTWLRDSISFIHLLPFYPWSSDDGFAVKDFRAIDPHLGTWDDIQTLSQNFRLVFDAVINHVSESSVYMDGYRNGDPQYKDYFISLDPETDTSAVLRTRNLPLLHEYDTCRGKEWLWTTFSRDQLDLNFQNPAVLLDIVDVLLGYLEKGASMIRLDAIPYLWKELGTSCAHLPQTHELIKLIYDIYQALSPGALLLTETNVPHKENISYFGNQGDEAQMIYNFSLAPLVAHALITADGSTLTQWAKQIEFISPKATYLNITATHDGIGMRPTEGILSEAERQKMCDRAKAHGGDITGKRNSDGSVSVYELNISYFDFLNDPQGSDPLSLQIKRFLLSQTIAMSFMGIPGIYIHSLLGGRNDLEGVKRTGRARSINRQQLDADEIDACLKDPTSRRAQVFTEMQRRLSIRSKEASFHPDAQQVILDIHPQIFALQRHYNGRNLIAIHSLSDQTITIDFPFVGIDLLNENAPFSSRIHCQPYQTQWILISTD